MLTGITIDCVCGSFANEKIILIGHNGFDTEGCCDFTIGYNSALNGLIGQWHLVSNTAIGFGDNQVIVLITRFSTLAHLGSIIHDEMVAVIVDS